MGWTSYYKLLQTEQKNKLVLTQVVANRKSSKVLPYQPSLGFIKISQGISLVIHLLVGFSRGSGSATWLDYAW